MIEKRTAITAWLLILVTLSGFPVFSRAHYCYYCASAIPSISNGHSVDSSLLHQRVFSYPWAVVQPQCDLTSLKGSARAQICDRPLCITVMPHRSAGIDNNFTVLGCAETILRPSMLAQIPTDDQVRENSGSLCMELSHSANSNFKFAVCFCNSDWCNTGEDTAWWRRNVIIFGDAQMNAVAAPLYASKVLNPQVSVEESERMVIGDNGTTTQRISSPTTTIARRTTVAPLKPKTTNIASTVKMTTSAETAGTSRQPPLIVRPRPTPSRKMDSKRQTTLSKPLGLRLALGNASTNAVPQRKTWNRSTPRVATRIQVDSERRWATWAPITPTVIRSATPFPPRVMAGKTARTLWTSAPKRAWPTVAPGAVRGSVYGQYWSSTTLPPYSARPFRKDLNFATIPPRYPYYAPVGAWTRGFAILYATSPKPITILSAPFPTTTGRWIDMKENASNLKQDITRPVTASTEASLSTATSQMPAAAPGILPKRVNTTSTASFINVTGPDFINQTYTASTESANQAILFNTTDPDQSIEQSLTGNTTDNATSFDSMEILAIAEQHTNETSQTRAETDLHTSKQGQQVAKFGGMSSWYKERLLRECAQYRFYIRTSGASKLPCSFQGTILLIITVSALSFVTW